MTRWNEGVFDSDLSAELVLRQAEIGVIVADRHGQRGVRERARRRAAAARLRRLAARAASRCSALGLLPDGEPAEGGADHPAGAERDDLGGHVRRATAATAAVCSSGSSRCPLRHPSGEIDGIVMLVTEAGRRDAQREPDRLRLLERIGERLAGLAWSWTPRCGRSRRSSSRSSPTTASSTCSAATSSSGGPPTHAGGWEPAAGHLGAGRRAHLLPARPLHAAGDGAAGDDRRPRPARRATTRRRASSPCRPPTRQG